MANETMMKKDKARSQRNAERVYLRSRIDLVDAPSGGVGDGAADGLIGGVVGAAAGAGGRFIADDGTRYLVRRLPAFFFLSQQPRVFFWYRRQTNRLLDLSLALDFFFFFSHHLTALTARCREDERGTRIVQIQRSIDAD